MKNTRVDERKTMSADPTSYSNPDVAVVKSYFLDWAVDFTSHTLKGSITLDYVIQKEGGNVLTLDSKGLKVSKVISGNDDELQYKFGAVHKAFGSALTINLPGNTKDGKVQIFYETSSDASALQWLKPEQTSGKEHPYLFSQCQAIHARSIMPCQDSPGVKSTYTACVTVQKPLVALMSAVASGHEEFEDKIKYKFEQKVPIPSYLLAIVVGKLTSKDIGPRSRVWAEEELVSKSAEEFVDTESFISAAESIVGPYVWGRYDLLVLPPSFPYGGMENPCLTFVTPTLLAGDRSLANVIAHEIAHSWTGNLVTNKTWEHFWLNEGHTVFLERKIISKIHGEDTRHFQALNGVKTLQNSIDLFGATNPHTNLVIALNDIDPDDTFSSVPYEKGHTLLFYLENLLGGPEVMDPFLLAYINKFKYGCLTSDQWKEFLFEYFTAKGKKDILDKVDWKTWFYTPGMPPVIPAYNKTLAAECHKLADKWCQEKSLDQFSKADLSNFSSWQVIEFLSQLNHGQPLTVEQYQTMDKTYNLSASKNSEIKFLWLRLGLKAKCESAIEPSLGMVTEQGRMKFTRPLYRDLGNWDKSRNQAIKCFEKNRCSMHSTTAQLVAKDLGI